MFMMDMCILKLFISQHVNRFERILLGVRELQADEVEDFGSTRVGVILDKLAELHLAVRLSCHIYHVDDFFAT